MPRFTLCAWIKNRLRRPRFIGVVGMGSSYHTMVANKGRASTCRTNKHTQEKTTRVERKVIIMAELADKRRRGRTITHKGKKAWSSKLILVFRATVYSNRW
jgi:hypothetical protein